MAVRPFARPLDGNDYFWPFLLHQPAASLRRPLPGDDFHPSARRPTGASGFQQRLGPLVGNDDDLFTQRSQAVGNVGRAQRPVCLPHAPAGHRKTGRNQNPASFRQLSRRLCQIRLRQGGQQPSSPWVPGQYPVQPIGKPSKILYHFYSPFLNIYFICFVLIFQRKRPAEKTPFGRFSGSCRP